MKKLFLLFASAVALSVVSCEKGTTNESGENQTPSVDVTVESADNESLRSAVAGLTALKAENGEQSEFKIVVDGEMPTDGAINLAGIDLLDMGANDVITIEYASSATRSTSSDMSVTSPTHWHSVVDGNTVTLAKLALVSSIKFKGVYILYGAEFEIPEEHEITGDYTLEYDDKGRVINIKMIVDGDGVSQQETSLEYSADSILIKNFRDVFDDHHGGTCYLTDGVVTSSEDYYTFATLCYNYLYDTETGKLSSLESSFINEDYKTEINYTWGGNNITEAISSSGTSTIYTYGEGRNNSNVNINTFLEDPSSVNSDHILSLLKLTSSHSDNLISEVENNDTFTYHKSLLKYEYDREINPTTILMKIYYIPEDGDGEYILDEYYTLTITYL